MLIYKMVFVFHKYRRTKTSNSCGAMHGMVSYGKRMGTANGLKETSRPLHMHAQAYHYLADDLAACRQRVNTTQLAERIQISDVT